MAIKKITFTNANVTAQNDADLYYFLQGGTGILKGIKNEVKASNNANRFIFESGYISIYGRLLFVDNNTDITVPLNRTAKGYVVLDINTSTNIAELTYTESTNGGYPILIQENLSTGVGHYQFAIAAYSKTSAALTPDQSFKPAYLYPHIEKQQGSSNANKVFMTDASGNFILVDKIPVSAIPATGVSVDTAKNLEKKDGTKIGADEVALKKDFNNVDNTSDKNKPISDATQKALDLKADKKDVSEVDIDLEGTGTIVSIPENAKGYGTIEKLGGKSSVINNKLTDFVNQNNTTYSVSSNVLTLNISSIDYSYIYFEDDVSNYNKLNLKFDVDNALNIIITADGTNIINNKNITSFNEEIDVSAYSKLTINIGGVVGTFNISNFSCNTDLVIQYPTNVTVVGRNLWSLSPIFTNTETDTRQSFSAFIYSGDTLVVTQSISSVGVKTLTFTTTNSTTLTIKHSGSATDIIICLNENFGLKPNTQYTLSFNILGYNSSVIGGLNLSNIMLNEGSTALPYTPYTEHNLPQTNIINYVSNELQTNHSWTQENASKWLGLGVGNDSNIINYANNKKGDVKYSIIDMGTLEWQNATTYYQVVLSSAKNLANCLSTLNLPIFTNYQEWGNSSSGIIIINNGTNTFIRVKGLSTTPTGLLIYELATPIEIDLSSLETEEHFECESNGSIIHDNLANYKYSFPVSLKGQVELNFEHDKEQQRDIDSLKKEIDELDNKKVPTTRTINGKALNEDINLSANDVGLGNVNNTSDADKPISTATQNALNNKANSSDLTAHKDNTSNPHNVTKTQLGLENVDNTKDIDKNVASAKILKNNEIGSFTLSGGFTSEINFNSNSVYLIYNNIWNFIIRTSGLKAQSTVCYDESDLKPLWFKFDNTAIIQRLYLKKLDSNSANTYSYNGTFNYKLLSTD